MPTTVDTSIYPTQPAAQPNLLGMASQFATTQNALNQNQLFQQTFAARKALGGIMQQSIGPDGNIDYNKASVLLSTNPDAAFMAPDIINGWVQRENLQADTVLKNLSIAQKKTQSLGDEAASLVTQGQSGQSYKDAQGNPVSNAVDQKDLIGATARLAALHNITPEDQMKFLTTVGVDPKTGKYDPKLGFQHLQQFALQQQGAEKTLSNTYDALSLKLGGTNQNLIQNKYAGTVMPVSGTNQPQGQTPETAGPGVPGVNTVTGAKTQTLQGQPLPAPVQAPGVPQRPQTALPGQGSGPETTMAGNPAAPAGINVGSGATPVPTTTTQLGPVQQKRLEAMPAYIKEANDQATKSLQMNQILDEMDKARSQFKTGGGMTGFIELAKGLQAAGVSNGIVDKIAGGNLGPAQEYGKLQAQLAAAVLKNALMPGAGRILQSEYETFNKANANYDTDPRAIDKMFQFMRKQNQINITRSTALNSISQKANTWKQGEPSPFPKGMSDLSDFEPWFNGKLVQSGMISGGTAKALRGQEGSDPANVTAPEGTLMADDALDDVEGQVLQDFAPYADSPAHITVRPAGVAAPPEDPESQVLRDFAPYSSAKDSATAPALGETATPGWNTAGNFLDSLLLGYGRNVGAFAESSKSGNVLDTYHKKLADLTAARDAWAKENPQAALATNIAGGTAGSLVAMGLGQEYAAAPLASALSKAAPMLAPVVDYLGGGAGAYGSGLDAALTRTGSLASRGMLEGASAGGLQSKLGEGSPQDQALGGASAGGLTNALLGPFASRLATSIAPDVAAASRGAISQGVPLRAGQLPGASPIVQTLDKFLSGAKNAPQREAFNSALTTQAGLPSKAIDQDWVAKADALNGGTMERITKGYSLDATDPDLNTDLADLDNRASSQMTFDGEKKWQELRGKLEKDLNTGSVPGQAYQAWTGKGGLLENYAKNPELKPFITGPDGLRDAIDGAWGRSIAATPSPTAGQDFAEWQQARRQYKNTRIIDDGVSEKGEYNPQSLLRAVQKRYGNARRAGDIGDLGTAGQFIYKPESAPAQSHSIMSAASRSPLAVGAVALLGDRLAEPAMHMLSRDWPTAIVGGAGLLGAAGAAKATNAVTSSQPYMRHLLDIAQGTGKPWLRGNNPLIPAISDIVSPRQ